MTRPDRGNGRPGDSISAGGNVSDETGRLNLADLNAGSDFVRAAGLQVTEAGPRRVVGFLDLGPRQHTPWGVVHGGVYTTAVESAASIGASAAVASLGQFAVGVNNTTDFLRSAIEGRAQVVAEAIYQGRTQQLWQVEIRRDSDGELLARGQVRLQNVHPRPPR
jgi:1,4-dihydroxy-2-naphthoyl-CoA hydrolase